MTGSPKLFACSEQNVIMFKILNPGKHFLYEVAETSLFICVNLLSQNVVSRQSLILIIVIKYSY